jgi:hypothetical protein
MHQAQSEPELLDDQANRLNRALSPVVAGMIIDGVDLATFGPIGLVLGLPIGGLAGYWLGKSLGLDKQKCLFCALAAGVYCAIPFTAPLPLATLVGAYARYRQTGPQQHCLPSPQDTEEDSEESVPV